MAFHWESSPEHSRVTQHNFNALINTETSIILSLNASLLFVIVEFLMLGGLYFHMKLKTILFLSFAKKSGALIILQTKVKGRVF